MLCPCGELGKSWVKSQLPMNSHISCRILFLPSFLSQGSSHAKSSEEMASGVTHECLKWIKAAFCLIDLLFSLSGVWISPGRSQRARGCLPALK